MNSRFPLSLDWIIENRPDLLPPVGIEGYPYDSQRDGEGAEWDGDLVSSVMEKLTPERRALMYALFVRGLSNREYALFRGVNESSVRRQRKRTLRTLRKLIEDERTTAA